MFFAPPITQLYRFHQLDSIQKWNLVLVNGGLGYLQQGYPHKHSIPSIYFTKEVACYCAKKETYESPRQTKHWIENKK